MRRVIAKANVNPVRQRTQYSCVSASTCMALNAVGVKCSEDEVNNVIGAKPMKGARWEEVLACAQYFGCRATLTTPATLTQIKAWTDAGKPVLIAWNPEGRDWSHASLVFDVTGEKGEYEVHVADPNIPNPDKTTRVVKEDEFYSKWYEKWPNYLVRRPALMIEREVDGQGRQIMASKKKKEPSLPKYRDPNAQGMFDGTGVGSSGKGTHRNRKQDVAKGRSRKQKHKKDLSRERMAERVAERMTRDPLRERFFRAVEETVSSIRHLGFSLVKSPWGTEITEDSAFISYKLTAVGIVNLSIDFQWDQHRQIAQVTEGRKTLYTAEGIDQFPNVLRMLPSRTSKLATSLESAFPCLLNYSNVTQIELNRALKDLPMGLRTRREIALRLAKNLGDVEVRGTLSLIDILLKDLNNLS